MCLKAVEALEIHPYAQSMSKLEKYANLVAVIVPFVAFAATVTFTWGHFVHGADLAILAGMYLVSALGITIGYH
ncbi:MAG: hypothetical protein QOE38_1549, partial [Thermoleophilaceae bacterium]|nr:hypothetical protein [Thermoleophilaceae bacterium]